MLLLSKIPQFFYSPEVPTGGGSTNTPTIGAPNGKEETIEFLGADDAPEVIDLNTPVKGPKTKENTETNDETETENENEEETEDDELKEIEKELEGPTDEQLELVTPVRRKEILAKYPNVFKDFPYLEKAYYRDQQFTELLPTIDDAKVAVEKSQTLDKFENEIMGGTTENILKAVREENPKGFLKIVDDYLPTLARVDEKAYMHVLGNITKHTIIAMVHEAKTSNNDILRNAAQILNQFVFGSSNFVAPVNLSKETADDKEETATNTRQQEFLRGQFESVNTDLNTRINNTLRNTIDAHIDPRKSMSDYVRKNATKDALETVGELISKDTRFKAITDKLWEKAFESNFDKTSMDKIRSAFLSRAKTLLPAVIKKARNEALRGTGHRVSDDKEETTSTNRGPIAAGRPRSQQSGGKVTSGKDIPKGMSTLDFLNS